MTAPTSPNWLRVGATVAAGRLRPPLGCSRRRAVCAAARVLTGLGVRVEVRAPSVAWPRTGTGLLLVANTVSALDPLALLTAVPGAAVAGAPERLAGIAVPTLPAVPARVATALRRGAPVTVRPEVPAGDGAPLGRFSPALLAAAVEAGAPVCPVAVRYRGTPTPRPPGRSTLAALRWLATAASPVIEVHLLPALHPAGAGAGELATLAEYAVAGVLEPAPEPDGLAAAFRRESARSGGQRGPATR